VKSIDLVTNNPRKIQELEAEGVHVRRRIPSVSESNPHNIGYLRAKRERKGHLLDNLDQKSSA
jgi:GTP cyclohydrolase II/3,4-dihydroxy 2-butanone 4-phosphate synthase/GTP cyclohydrolase II